MTHEPMPGFSRRRALQLGSLTAGAVALGLGGVAHAAPGTDAGADGAPADDPSFSGKFAQSAQSMEANALAATSYNGWPVGSPASVINVGSHLVPGTSIRCSSRTVTWQRFSPMSPAASIPRSSG